MSLIASHVSDWSDIGVQVSALSDIALQVSAVSFSSSHFSLALTTIVDSEMISTLAFCLLVASTTISLLATIVSPLLPMILVDTLIDDASTISNAPNATLVALVAIVLLSLMVAAPITYRTAAAAMVLVSLMLAAPMA